MIFKNLKLGCREPFFQIHPLYGLLMQLFLHGQILSHRVFHPVKGTDKFPHLIITVPSQIRLCKYIFLDTLRS